MEASREIFELWTEFDMIVGETIIQSHMRQRWTDGGRVDLYKKIFNLKTHREEGQKEFLLCAV